MKKKKLAIVLAVVLAASPTLSAAGAEFMDLRERMD